MNGVGMVSWNVTYNPKQGVKAERAPLHYSKGGSSKEAAVAFPGMLRKKDFPQMAISEPSAGLGFHGLTTLIWNLHPSVLVWSLHIVFT